MLELFKSVDRIGSPSLEMKHPRPTQQTYEFNLGKALELKCTSSGRTEACGSCESCVLVNEINLVKSWFPRLGDHSKRRFLLGLVRRFHSVDLLQYVSHILQPLLFKDFTYARARTNPSLDTDKSTVSSDRALPRHDVEKYISDAWAWFGKSNYWSKSNYTIALLQLCDAHLLFNVGVQAKTLLVSEEKAALSSAQSFTESESIMETECSYSNANGNNPDLSLLAAANPYYTNSITHPLTGEDMEVEAVTENNDSGDESLTESQPSTVDPTILVIPASAKAHSGVSRYKDFIRYLPVHLAKFILSHLDKASLYNALCVSKNWRKLAEEVHKEFFVNQQLLEEVMLMQGGASQGADPTYAKDIDILVPNINSQTWETITTTDQVIKPTFKSEISHASAFSGVSTRKVIMEERNVYCGAYNVLVLRDCEDLHRQVHTDGGKFICLGSKDRKVRFLDAETGRETGPLITGHAGSVRCVHICEEKKIVLSGSYDTSIRVWNIETGQCLKILRGHRDTVLTVTLCEDTVASGAKDGSCKIWNIQTGKCLRSFRHKEPVGCVALGTKMCITGCDGGKVKVWDLTSGNLIKRLNGHHGPLTGIKFDRWHIVTASKDCYALAWSSQGDFSRCLAAMRHQKEVLCMELLYLRVITGSADGRLRIWNMVTGQCCRIMRGNSRSDPILSIIASGDRITLNTQVNLLVLNFEKVKWDYTLESDKVAPLVQYGKYSDAPTRSQPYPYIRAQRMQAAGASNQSIVKHERTSQDLECVRSDLHVFKAEQIAHSAKALSSKSLQDARLVQSGIFTESSPEYRSQTTLSEGHMTSWAENSMMEQTPSRLTNNRSSLSPLKTAHAMTTTAITRKLRPHTSKSAPHVSVVDPRFQSMPRESAHRQRRVSWAFETPAIPKSSEISLSETKALFRSQMRMKEEHRVPPDFIYLAVNSIQSSMKPNETNLNMAKNMQESVPKSALRDKKGCCRPSSSPSRIDPRTRVPIEDLGLDNLRAHFDYESVAGLSEAEEVKSIRPAKDTAPKRIPPPDMEVYAAGFEINPVNSAPHFSTYGEKIPCSLPTGRSIRPQSSYFRKRVPSVSDELSVRPVTAIGLQRPATQSSVTAALPGVPPAHKPSQLLSSSNTACHTPMLMYSQDLQDKISKLKDRQSKKRIHRSSSVPAQGNVSRYNGPLRSHIKFELRTHEQEEQVKNSINKAIKNKKAQEAADLEKKRRAVWLKKAKGNCCGIQGQMPISLEH